MPARAQVKLLVAKANGLNFECPSVARYKLREWVARPPTFRIDPAALDDRAIAASPFGPAPGDDPATRGGRPMAVPWEIGWRSSGTMATGLVAGNYEIEFRAVPGYQPVWERLTNAVTTNALTELTNYHVGGSQGAGWLQVNVEPNVVATNGGWSRNQQSIRKRIS